MFFSVTEYFSLIRLGLDILINFLTCSYDGSNNLIFKFPEICLNYISGWFFIDFIATIPFDYLIFYSKENSFSLSANRIARFFRIQRIFSIYVCLQKINNFRISQFISNF